MLKIRLNLYSVKREDNIFPFFDSTISSKSKSILHRTFIAIVLLFNQAAFSATYKIQNGSDIAGEVAHYTVTGNETFYSIARQFDLGIVELMATNPGIDPWIPTEGTLLSLPTSYVLPKVKRHGIVINLPELRLFYFIDAKTIMTFPIGIGRDGWQTPIGETTITLKRKNPSWVPPASIMEVKPHLPKIVPAGPDNPLGAYALNLGFKPGSFLIHGTNRPHGIGLRSSHGCIRMYPEDIEVLFNTVKKGTKVTVIDTPYKLGWLNNILYLEVTPTQEQIDDIANHREPEALVPVEIYKDIDKIVGINGEVDWPAVDEAIIKRTGLPVAIVRK